MSRTSALERNGILRHVKTPKPSIWSLQREKAFYHYDTMLRGLPSAAFLKRFGTLYTPQTDGVHRVSYAPW